MDDSLTMPEVKEVQIVYNANMPGLLNFFGPIHIRKEGMITIRDTLRAIYDFFQVPITQEQANYMERTYPDVWKDCVEAFRTRCTRSQHIAIPVTEWRQGVKRVDCLGDRVKYWGMWATHNPDATWQLNLGLVPASNLAPYVQN
ncbi:hypothetical protein BV20DRAFT_953601 [Pilatotrama ljubarskyi]|nr:hypothetical protein BV20DRAFT_953601 [Pilatotrama ljubarskyi]